MRDIDQLLAASGNPQPHRPLRANFTSDIIEHIKAQPRQASRLARAKEKILMNLHKPTIAFAAAAIAILLLGSTAYALTHWNTVTSVFRSETVLPSGNRIVGVDTTNCNYFGKPDPKAAPQETAYYEIKKESSLTNDQVVDMIKGICEENRANDAVNTIIQPYLKDGQNIMSSSGLRVASIDKDKLSVTNDPAYSKDMRYSGDNTYTLGKDVKVFDGTSPIKLSDIKAGDTLRLIVHDKRTIGSEGDRDDPNHWDDPQFIDILAMIRVPALSGSPDTFFGRLGTDFVRVERCDSDPSGFCRVYQFDPQP
jgi:hypothetical protein